ncbi:MAG: hypothetical protein ABI411_19075 [Tahibacter sp.]
MPFASASRHHGAAIDIGAEESPSDSSGVVIVDTTASSGETPT